MLPAKRRGYHNTNHPDYKDKVVTVIWLRAEALTNCLTCMVKSSETDNEKASENSSGESYCAELAAREYTVSETLINPLSPELNPICYLLALLAHHFLCVSRIRVKSLTLRLLIYYMEHLFLMFVDHTQ
jgi:hypothetical protein